jgi:hypothetical protein
MPVIPALGRLRQEDHEFKASLVYKPRPCLKKQTNKQKQPRKQKERGKRKGKKKRFNSNSFSSFS